ncbi:hypothetical protein [Planomonospora sp. ID67723]|nr:hypothetical protein [Planomonospora sp. ID67723]
MFTFTPHDAGPAPAVGVPAARVRLPGGPAVRAIEAAREAAS